MSRRVDVTGKRIGRLVVIGMQSIGRNAGCVCRCDCGDTKLVRLSSLRAGYTRSCGCIASERIAHANRKHGHTTGGKPTDTWITWRSMHQRCEDQRHKSYADYGGRGITVCERWDSFESFVSDMGWRPPGRQIDRIDNDGKYEPGNCRWVTPKQNSNNRRPARRRTDGRQPATGAA